jgi:hypothetical protein
MLALTIELGLMITCWAIRLLRYHFSTLNAADVLISTENAQRDKDGVKETKAERGGKHCSEFHLLEPDL